MEKINKKASIFILNYNGIYWLKRNLNNLIKYSPNIPITVIDNNSFDKSIQYIENNFPKSIPKKTEGPKSCLYEPPIQIWSFILRLTLKSN